MRNSQRSPASSSEPGSGTSTSGCIQWISVCSLAGVSGIVSSAFSNLAVMQSFEGTSQGNENESSTIGHSTPTVEEGEMSRSEKVDVSYMMGDVKSLIEAHEKIDLDNVAEHNEDPDRAGSEYIKAFVLGGLDGIVSTFALVASMDGARISAGPMVAVGLAKVLSDAFSMGFGEFTSATAELEHSMAILNRETWETENHLDGEVKEMCEIYMKRGSSKEDALTMMTVLSKYKDLFIENMLVMEHGMLPPDIDDKWQPLKQGFVCFFAFAIFGLIPLAGFIVLYAMQGNVVPKSSQTMLVAYGMTASTLFAMGVMKAKLTGQPKQMKSGLLMVLNGTVAGGVAYLIGEMLVALIES